MPTIDTQNKYSPDLVALLSDLHERGEITRKEFSDGADIGRRTVDNIFTHGWEAWDKVKQAIRGVKLTVAYDMLVLLVGGRFSVSHRGAEADGCEGVQGALKIAAAGVEMSMRIVEADADKVRTEEEAAAILSQINHIRRCCDAVEMQNQALLGRRRAAAG